MTTATAGDRRPAAETTTFGILAALSLCHFFNDVMQSLITAIYPLLKDNYALDFGQIGLLTLVFNGTASLLQPLIGFYTDKRPQPYSLVVGMGSSLAGLFVLAYATSYGLLLVGAALVGLGSAIFHPESSRMARLASGGRHGLAQSLFQVGGNVGTAAGPLFAAFIILPRGQESLAWFAGLALTGMVVLARVGAWYAGRRAAAAKSPAPAVLPPALPRGLVLRTLIVLALLIFSKYIYIASLSSYYTFYAIERFGVSVQGSQILLFMFLGGLAAGTLLGGPIGDRFGRKLVIWGSILGALPFTLVLPYAGLVGTAVLTVVIGLIMASAFSAILVYAQELVPGKVGMISGLFFGFAFGMGGIGAAVLGQIADARGIGFVFTVCSFLPLIGLLTIFLPDIEAERRKAAA
ncbi:MAG: MFS transporter [Proteobacteria bacterium]|nr:MFS transporter [Pseudomonadota bacterium]